MAAYNAQKYLKPAIDSILDQTLAAFELIIVNDGSTDDTAAIVASYKDPRIVYINQNNLGLAAALNNGIRKARGSYIARMDADDIALPNRLQLQVELLDNNPDLALVGNSYEIIDEGGTASEQFTALTQPDDVREEFLIRNPFGHGTVMFRKEVFDAVGGYDETPGAIEDYLLWWQIAKDHPVGNVASIQYQWRVVKSGISHGSSAERQQPIRNVLDKIWSQNSPTKMSPSGIRRRYSHYRQTLPPETGRRLGDQYINNQYAVGLALIAKKRYAAGWMRIVSSAVAVPSSIKNLSDLYYLNRSMRGYNLNLLLKGLRLPGRKIAGLIRKTKKEMPR